MVEQDVKSVEDAEVATKEEEAEQQKQAAEQSPEPEPEQPGDALEGEEDHVLIASGPSNSIGGDSSDSEQTGDALEFSEDPELFANGPPNSGDGGSEENAGSGESSEDEVVTEVSEEFAETAAGRESPGDGESESGEAEPEPVAETGAADGGVPPETSAVVSEIPADAAEPETSAATYPDADSGPEPETKAALPEEDDADGKHFESIEPPISTDDGGQRTTGEPILTAPSEPAGQRDSDDDKSDDVVTSSERVEKPVVEEQPAPGAFPAVPDAADAGTTAATREESLDVIDLASGDSDPLPPSRQVESGDGDVTDPVKPAPELVASGDGDVTDPQKAGAEKLNVGDASGATAAEIESDDAPASEELEDETATGSPDTAAVGSDPSKVEKSESDLDDPGIEEPAPPPVAEPASAADSADAARSTATDQLVESGVPNPSPPEADRTAIADPYTRGDASDSTPPMSGPDLGDDNVIADHTSAVDPVGRGGGSGPVTDSSGIQDGGVPAASFKKWDDGTISVHMDASDGSRQVMTQESKEAGGRYIETTVSADEKVVTETTKKDGKVIETRRETTEDDETLVTEVTTYDENGRAVKTTRTEHKSESEGDDRGDDQGSDADGDGTSDEQETSTNTGSQQAAADSDSSSNAADSSPSRPANDYGDVPGVTAKADAMQQEEAAWQQGIRAGSNVNPGRGEGAAEDGGGSPPPGVDDPPEDDSLAPEEDLEVQAPGGDSEGAIDFGPDHVEQNQTSGGDPGVSEALGPQSGESGLTEGNPADGDASYTLDPAAMQDNLDDIQRAISGGVEYLPPIASYDAESDDEADLYQDDDF